jgi:Tfp pilus assembly protein FimV
MKMATSPATLTLTKRGRTVLMVSALILATSTFAATFSAFNGAAASTTSVSDAPIAAEEIIVQPGESYWSIARAIAPGRSTQDLIDQIHQLNPFVGATLQAGTKILVPLIK